MSNLLLPPALGARVVSREPYTDVRIDEAVSGKEARSSWWLAPRYRYKVALEVLRSDAGSRLDYQQIASLFTRHFGRLDSFLFTDDGDSSVTDHGFGVGDGATTTFQLQRSLLGSTYDLQGGPWAASSKPRTNLALNSQAFGSWGANAVTVLSDVAVAPDNTVTADHVVETSATDWHGCHQGFSVVSGTYTVSVWLKAAERTVAVVYNGAAYVPVDLSTGTLGAVAGGSGTATIFASGGGWYRVTLAVAQIPGSLNIVVSPVTGTVGSPTLSYAGTTGSGIYAWGGQFELASSATPYIATAAAAVTSSAYWPSLSGGFEPVWDLAPGALLYVDGDGLGRRTLSPVSRTNVLKYSQGAGATGWNTSQAGGITYNVAGAPDGTATAIQFVESAALVTHDCYNVNLTLVDGVWTGSVYVKRISGTRNVILRMQGKASYGRSAIFDGARGAVVATPYPSEAVASGCEVCENGWLRFWVSAPCSTTGAFTPLLSVILCNGATDSNYAGDGTSTVLVWGGQVEQSAAIPAAGLGDYIATTAATASRTDYVLGSTGGVTLAVAPRTGAALSWSGSYYKRVRLAGEGLQMERLANGMWATTVDLITTKP